MPATGMESSDDLVFSSSCGIINCASVCAAILAGSYYSSYPIAVAGTRATVGALWGVLFFFS